MVSSILNHGTALSGMWDLGRRPREFKGIGNFRHLYSEGNKVKDYVPFAVQYDAEPGDGGEKKC